MVLLDGLLPNGPIIELCRKKHWDFMIVLQNNCLPSVWEEYEVFKELEPKNHLNRELGESKATFQEGK